ncbi:MAG: O-antigen ligase family protein [Caldilineaceae bacterium]|nr:O-antigen ligase family protein [Caldilineaceae bacterium]
MAYVQQRDPIHTLVNTGVNAPTLDLVELLYCAAVFLAPIELRVVSSFTVHDCLMLLIAALLIVGPRRMIFLPKEFVPPIFLFLIFALLSTFRAPYPYESLTQIAQYLFIFFVHLPVILTVVQSRLMVRLSFVLFVGGALLVAGLAMMMHHVQGAGRMLTFFSDNPNRLGYPSAYLLPVFLFCLFALWRRFRFRPLVLLLVPALYVLMWALAASGSRSSTVGAVAALMLFLSFRKGLQINWQLFARVIITAALIGGIGYVLYQTEYFPDVLRDRVERTLNMEETLVDDRRRLAVAGLLAFADSPIIGIGLDNFRYVAREYLPESTAQPPHNLWIQFLAQIGLVGTLMFACIIGGWYWLLLKAERRAPSAEAREELWALLAAFSAVQVIYLFLPIMIQRQYWLLYGLGLSAALQILNKQMQHPAALNATRV